MPGLVAGLRCPKISIILTVCDPEPTYLAKALESVAKQSNQNWELCIADDASRRADVRALLAQTAANDHRVKLLLRDERGGISATNNSAFKLVTSEFVTFLGHVDLLAPRTLELCAAFLALHPETEILYSDEDKIDDYERRSQPYFKPDYSPELIHSCNYMNHLIVHRAKNLKLVDGWRSAYDGAQDYDLLLRIIDFVDAKNVQHISEILYHRRMLPSAGAFNPDYKPYCLLAGKRSLQDAFTRRGIAADVSVVNNFLYRTRYRIKDAHPKVTIIIPTRDRLSELEACLISVLTKTTYPNYDIRIMDNESELQQTKTLFETFGGLANVRVVSFIGPFNFAAINNKAASLTDGELLCLLNNDTEVITDDWLNEMVGFAMQPRIGCVGAKLYYKNNTLQHGGVVLGLRGMCGHAFMHASREAVGYFGRLVVASNYSAVTGACLLIRKSIYEEVGGLDERLAIAFNDIDLCLKVRNRGYWNVWTPFAELYHLESRSRGPDITPSQIECYNQEARVMKARYDESFERDPFYSPHLSLERDFEIKTIDSLKLE
jgi:GT2 family glycosyltransferase